MKSTVRKLCLAISLPLVGLATGLLSPCLSAVEVRVTTRGDADSAPLDNPHFRIEAAGPGWVRAQADQTGIEQLKESGAVFDVLRDTPRNDPNYLTYPQILQRLDSWEETYPNLVRLEDIGTSGDGRPLRVLRITDQPDTRELEPEIKFVASMHGDEPIAGDLCLRFARYLLENYATDSTVKTLVNATDFYLLPVMNPDGYSAVPRTRLNAAGTDLNRNFPSVADPVNTTAGRPPETAAVMNWTAAHRFVLSIGFHSGSLGAVYPWGHAANLPLDEQNPETALFRELCFTYAAGNSAMWARNGNGWEHGVQNAADWYVVFGEMADWNYRWYGDLEITVEVSTTKEPFNPGFDQSWSYWDQNRDAMLAFLTMGQRGVRGLVTDSGGSPAAVKFAPGRLPVPANSTDRPVGLALLHLDPGWNLVSLPLDPDDPAPAAVFPGAETPVWGWDGVRYRAVQQCTAYVPVWVFSTAELDLTIHGVTAEDSQQTPLLRGWNLVGPKGAAALPTTGQASVSAVAWDAGADSYTWVAPGTALDPLRGYWFFANSATSLDLTEGDNRPFPSRSAPEDGACFRVLLGGKYAFSFQDSTEPGIAHTPPAGSVVVDTDFALHATTVIPAPPLQVFGLDVPASQARSGLPAHLRFDPVLPAPEATCLIVWSIDNGDHWTETAMNAATPDTWSHSFHAPADPGWFSYYFRLVRGDTELSALGDAREPFKLEIVDVGRGLVRPAPIVRDSPVDNTEGRGASWSGQILGR